MTTSAAGAGARAPLIYFIVGEPSGDQIGAHLMRALDEQTQGAVSFAGLGGQGMSAAGLESLFPIDLFAVMGLDFLPGLREILKRMKQLEADIEARRPDCIVMIDAQTLSHRMGKRLHRLGIPIVQYVAPTVWAWRAGRAKRIARHLTRLLTIFPFEAPWFEPHGLPVTFVGHPAAEPDPLADADIDTFKKDHDLMGDAPVLCLLPGSRRKEVRRQLPLYRSVLERLRDSGASPVCIMPVVDSVRDQVAALSGEWPTRLISVPSDTSKYLAFGAADVALAASGTVTVELAVAGTPTVVCYKLPWHESRIGRMVLKTPYVSAVNIVAGSEVMPECVLERCKPDLITRALAPLLQDPGLRAQQAGRIREVAGQLSVPGHKPSVIAAQAIHQLIREPQPS